MNRPDQRTVLEAFKKALRREAHNLTSPRVAQFPAFFWQQTYNRLQWADEAGPVTRTIAPELEMRRASSQGLWAHDIVRSRESEAYLTTLVGHTNRLTSCAFSPDGTRIVSGSLDNTLRIWDARSGRTLSVLEGHAEVVTSCAFSMDGTRIVSGSLDNTLRIWDARSGQFLSVLEGHSEHVYACSFSPDGTSIVSGSRDNTLRIWDARSGRALSVLEGHTGWVTSCAFSMDGARIVSGGFDKAPRIWDARTGRVLRVLKRHREAVTSCAFSPDGTRIVSGGLDNTLRVWDARSGRTLSVLNKHWVTSCAFSPDGTRIVSGSIGSPWRSDDTLRVWDACTQRGLGGLVRNRRGRTLSVLHGHAGGVLSCAFSPDGGRIVSGSEDETLRVWDATSGQTLPVPGNHEYHSHRIASCSFSPDGTRIVSGSNDKTLRVWDAVGGQTRMVLAGHTEVVSSCAFSPDGRSIVSGAGAPLSDTDSTLRIWDARARRGLGGLMRRKRGLTLSVLHGHTGGVAACAYAPDGRRIVSGAEDMTLRIWDARARRGLGGLMRRKCGRTLSVLAGHVQGVGACVFSPDGARVLSGSGEDLRVWDAASGQTLYVLGSPAGWVSSWAFSPDGTRIVSGSSGSPWRSDDVLLVWDARSGQVLSEFAGHADDVTCCTFSPDGTRIVSGSLDSTLRIWDANSGEELLVVLADNGAHSVALSPTHAQIAYGNASGVLHILDIYEPAPVRLAAPAAVPQNPSVLA